MFTDFLIVGWWDWSAAICGENIHLGGNRWFKHVTMLHTCITCIQPWSISVVIDKHNKTWRHVGPFKIHILDIEFLSAQASTWDYGLPAIQFSCWSWPQNTSWLGAQKQPHQRNGIYDYPIPLVLRSCDYSTLFTLFTLFNRPVDPAPNSPGLVVVPIGLPCDDQHLGRLLYSNHVRPGAPIHFAILTAEIIWETLGFGYTLLFKSQTNHHTTKQHSQNGCAPWQQKTFWQCSCL